MKDLSFKHAHFVQYNTKKSKGQEKKEDLSQQAKTAPEKGAVLQFPDQQRISAVLLKSRRFSKQQPKNIAQTY
ncbi:MAG: hypothetical protein IKM34_08705 [Clostridia bacterium]|nr:hypothetical protein [Clostridia bacterium]